MLAVTIGIADTVMVSTCRRRPPFRAFLWSDSIILLITVFSSLATGGAVIAAQYIGRGDRRNAGSAAKQLFYSILALGRDRRSRRRRCGSQRCS